MKQAFMYGNRQHCGGFFVRFHVYFCYRGNGFTNEKRGKHEGGAKTAVRERALTVWRISGAILTAITKAEADRIKSALLVDDLISYAQMYDYEATMKELMIAASTSGSIGVVLSAAGAFVSQFDELIPYQFFLQKFQQFTHLNLIIISLIVLFAIFLGWFISMFYNG
jgi:hypothetical protein